MLRDKLKLGNKSTLVVISICLIIIYLDFTFLINKQLQGIRKLEPKIVKLKENLDRFARDQAKMQDVKNKQPAANQNKPAAYKRIISEGEIASLLQDISILANKNNVKIEQMRPLRESGAQKQQEKSQAAGKFSPLAVNLDLYCDYHHLGAFVNDLENAPIFVAVQEIKIRSQETDYLNQKVNLVLKTYVKK